MDETTTITIGAMYAFIRPSEKIGQFIIPVSSSYETYTIGTLQLPEAINQSYTTEELYYMLENKHLELVETLPSEVFSLVKAQYIDNNKAYTDLIDKHLK